MSEPSESLIRATPDLATALSDLAAAMDRQNELLVQIVAQNADLIALVVNDEDEEDADQPKVDLAGRPIPS